MSDDIEDIDLLDMFSNDTDTPVTMDIDTPVIPEKPKKVVEEKSIFDMLGNSGNIGSGDISQDLVNWFNGSDKLPSDPLASFLNSSALKAEFGMFFNMISNFARMKRLQEFVDQAEMIYFNPDDVLSLTSEELKSRLTTASSIIQNLYEVNRRTIASMKNKNKEDEMDKLKILLSAIPNNKLKEIISNLNG
jgi:hypothetical protein